MSTEYKNHEDPFQAAAEKTIAENKENENAVEPVIEDDNASIEDIKIVPEATEEVETPEVEEVVEPEITNEESELSNEDDTTLVEEPASTGDEEVSIEEGWDATTEDEEVIDNPPVEFDYSSLAKDLGIEATNKAEIIEKVNAIKEASSQQAEETAGLPDNLKKAIEIAQLDGDFLQYLGVTSVDYNQVDNAVLVQDQLANLPSMQTNGQVDVEKLAEALEGMSDLDIEMRGNEIKTRLIAQQDGFKANVAREAQEAKDAADVNLKAALEGLQEVRGFKVNGTHKKKLYDAISSGQMVQDLFYGADGKMDYNKVAKIVFDATYGDKINSFLKQRITTSTKKDLLDKLSNKQIEPKAGDMPNVSGKPKTPEKQLADQLAGR